MPVLRIFGGAAFEGEKGLLSGPVVQRHRIALLALLAVSHPRGLPRERLMALLWPERNAEHGRKLLNQAVHTLRKGLGENIIVSAVDELRLDAGVIDCDVIAFHKALREGERERAIDLYAGPFLDGFFLPETPEFDQWVEREREQLRRLYTQALEELAVKVADSDRGSAVEWWRRLAGEDPYNSRVTLRLMEALESLGDRAGAIKQARLHAALLQQEFEAAPDPEITAFAERLRTVPAAAVEERRQHRAGEGGIANHDPGAAPVTAAARNASSLTANTTRDSRVPAPGQGTRPVWRNTRMLAGAGIGLAAAVAAAWLLSGGTPRAGAVADVQGDTRKVVAVLPFENLSAGEGEAAFTNGIHSDLITALSGVASLAVISRASVMPYRSSDKPVRQIGLELGADALLEGGVQWMPDRLRVNAQLSDAKTGRLLWADGYERELTVGNIFIIQSEIAEGIAASLEASLTATERQRLATPYTENLTAYQYYQKAVATYAGTRAANEEEERLLRLALEVDPDFAPAWSRLASNYGWRAPYLGYPIWTWDSAHVYVGRALEMDPNLSTAYGVLALIHGHQGFLDRQEQAAREGLRRRPNATFPLRRLAESYRDRGDFVEALRLHREAVSRSPNSLHHRTWVAHTYADLGDYAEAARWYRGVFQLQPDYHNALQGAALLSLQRGQRDSAMHYAESMATRYPDEPHGLATAAMVGHFFRDFELVSRYAHRAIEIADPGAPVRDINGLLVSTMLGFARLQASDTAGAASLFDQSLAFLEGMVGRGAETPRWPHEIALIRAASGDVEGALSWLQTAYDRGFRWAWMLELDPMLDPLREDPRFLGLVVRMRAEVQAMRHQVARQATQR